MHEKPLNFLHAGGGIRRPGNTRRPRSLLLLLLLLLLLQIKDSKDKKMRVYVSYHFVWQKTKEFCKGYWIGCVRKRDRVRRGWWSQVRYRAETSSRTVEWSCRLVSVAIPTTAASAASRAPVTDTRTARKTVATPSECTGECYIILLPYCVLTLLLRARKVTILIVIY